MKKTLEKKDSLTTLITDGKDKRSTKRWAIGCTLVYLLLFPFFFYGALLSIMVFDGPSITVPIGLSIIFTWFWIPLSMPIAIYLIWSHYSQGQYKKAQLSCCLPFLAFGAFVLANALIHFIFL